MLKNSSSFTESSILMAVRQPPARQEISLGAGLKVRSRWPFTVESAGGATSVQPRERAQTGPQGSSFVT